MRFIVSALAFLSLASPAFAADDCAGKEGKDLKDCQKAAKDAEKQAKVDDRSTPYLPSQLDAKLSKLDANNPFATDTYRVRFTPTGIQQIDDYLIKCAKMKATVVFARWYVDQAGAGQLADLATYGPDLIKLLAAVPNDAASLKTDGQTLLGQLPKILAGPNAMKIPKITTALNDAIQDNLVASITEAPGVATSLAGVVK